MNQIRQDQTQRFGGQMILIMVHAFMWNLLASLNENLMRYALLVPMSRVCGYRRSRQKKCLTPASMLFNIATRKV